MNVLYGYCSASSLLKLPHFIIVICPSNVINAMLLDVVIFLIGFVLILHLSV